MKKLLGFLNSPPALITLLILGFSVDLIILGRHFGLDAGQWASWVQAVGSIAAILGAFAIAYSQHQKERRLERERRAIAELRAFEVVLELMTFVNFSATGLLSSVRDFPTAVFDPPEAPQLDDFAKSIRALPLFELPHKDLVIYCTSVPRAIERVLPLIAECRSAFMQRSRPDFGQIDGVILVLGQIVDLSTDAQAFCTNEVARLSP